MHIDELPMWNWKHIRETGNLIYLLDKKNYDKDNLLDKLFVYTKLKDVWNDIFNQWIREFGIDEKYKKRLQKEIKIMIMTCDRWINDDRSMETFIDIKKAELSKGESNAEEVKFSRQLALINKFTGLKYTEKNVTVKEFYANMELYKEHIDEIIKQTREHGKSN